MFLRERLKALKDGWEELRQMWDNRQELLSQSMNYQIFMRDAKQAEVLLAQQEHVLAKDETPVSCFNNNNYCIYEFLNSASNNMFSCFSRILSKQKVSLNATKLFSLQWTPTMKRSMLSFNSLPLYAEKATCKVCYCFECE